MKYEHAVTDLPAENEYPKLIRDRIPEIIKANGGTIETRTLINDAELLKYLLKKITEEAEELTSATTDVNLVEEIADLREVLDAILALKGVSPAEIAAIQTEKRAKRGGFALRLLMLEKSKPVGVQDS